MQDVSDLERRIVAALERIARAAGPGRVSEADAEGGAELARLRIALEAEQQARAGLQRTLDDVAAAQLAAQAAHEAEIGALKAAHAAQSRDLVALAEQLKADLAALRAARQAEADEVAGILAALGPLVEEAQNA